MQDTASTSSKENKESKESKVENKSSQPVTALQPLVSLRDEIDHVFDRFFRHTPLMERRRGMGLFDWGGFPRRALPEGVTLRSDFSESDDAYELTVEMPGLTDKDVDVSVSDDTVTVKGEKALESEKKEDNFHLTERSYGAFRRSFTLPAGVKGDGISAKVANGVLTVSMPKTPEAKKKPRKIKVKSS